MTNEFERLRTLLDERGEPYVKNGFGITWRYYSDPHTAEASMDGTLMVSGLTAEQAIRATDKECSIEHIYLAGEGIWKYTLSCGHSVLANEHERPRFCQSCGRKVSAR